VRPDSPSRQQFAEGYYLTAETGKWFWQHYTGGAAVQDEPTACPLCATLEQLAGLPLNVANALAGSTASRASIAQACTMLRELLVETAALQTV
jgi:acetyl esterase/lipase